MADQNIKSLFRSAEQQRKAIESSTLSSSSATYQSSLATAIDSYESCMRLVDRLALFSPNETVEDIASGDLQFIPIPFHIAELTQRLSTSSPAERKDLLRRAREAYERFLNILDSYRMLDAQDQKMYEGYIGDSRGFSVMGGVGGDPGRRREEKIKRFKRERELKGRVEFLSQNPAYAENDEDVVRQVHLANIALCTHTTFQSLESLNRELDILDMAPSPGAPTPQSLERDYRERAGLSKSEYSDRLDAPSLLSSNSGPILSSSGKPLRPFTLLDTRQTLKNGVFKPGHNLPTMTIDEYLEEERARGGIIEGGGEESGRAPEVDEDDYEKADEETMKKREWDEYVESNPRGSGNTLNRG